MSRSVPPEFVDVYVAGDSINEPPSKRVPFAIASRAVEDKWGTFRDHKHKLVLFARTNTLPKAYSMRGESCHPAAALTERYAMHTDAGAVAVINGVPSDRERPAHRGWR